MHFRTTITLNKSVKMDFSLKLKQAKVSNGAISPVRLSSSVWASYLCVTHTHPHTRLPQIPNYKEKRSVRRCLIKTTDQLTAQLAWLIRGSVGTKALSVSVSVSPSWSCTHTHTHTLSQGFGAGHGCHYRAHNPT